MLHHPRRFTWLTFPLVSVLALAACSCGDGGGESSGSGTSSAGGSGGATAATTSGPGPGPVTTSTGATSTTSTGSGTGGGDPGWRRVPWDTDACPIEYAENPVDAFPRLEWTPCPAGPEGCEVLVKNWPEFASTGQSIFGAFSSAGGWSVALSFVLDGEGRMVLTTPDGTPGVAYRQLNSDHCVLSRLLPTPGGHWMGGQDILAASKYVFQAKGRPPEDAIAAALTSISQRQAASEEVFVAELEFASAIKVFDRASGKVFTSPPALSSYEPRMAPGAVFYLRADASDDPTAWVWDRATGLFRELIGAGGDVVADVQGDGETLVWVETPPFDAERGVCPPGVLYTSPFTTDPKAIVPTARWSNFPVAPGTRSTIGGGLYAAVGDTTRSIYILRLADGQRWTLPIPDDEFASPVKTMPYIDADILFLETETQIHRIHLDALGPGTAE